MATRSASSEVKLSFQSTIKNTLDNGEVASVGLGDTIISGTLSSGIEASQANRTWVDTSRSLSSGNTEDIDIYDFAAQDIGAGNGNDGLGLALALEEIVTFCIKHVSGSGSLELMPTDPANPVAWMPSLTVANGGALKAGGVFLLHQINTDAFDITDASSNKIRVGANGGDIVYAMYILGRHDDNASSSSSSSTSSSSTSSSSSSSSSSQSSSSTSSSSTQSA